MTMPNFLVLGAAKCGTTSMYHYLSQHPQIYMSPLKETNYLAYEGHDSYRFQITTIDAYQALFDGATDEIAVGDSSPIYLSSSIAAGRVRELIPEAKLIAIIRNPVDRAFSDYAMHVRQRGATSNVREAFADKDAVYVQGGFYHARLKRYFEVFERDQIRVYVFEQFRSDPGSVLRDVFGFLGVSDEFLPDTSTGHNKGSFPKSRPVNNLIRLLKRPTVQRYVSPFTPAFLRRSFSRLRQLNGGPLPEFPSDIRAELAHLYSDEVLRVEDLTGCDLSHWLVEDGQRAVEQS